MEILYYVVKCSQGPILWPSKRLCTQQSLFTPLLPSPLALQHPAPRAETLKLPGAFLNTSYFHFDPHLRCNSSKNLLTDFVVLGLILNIKASTVNWGKGLFFYTRPFFFYTFEYIFFNLLKILIFMVLQTILMGNSNSVKQTIYNSTRNYMKQRKSLFLY